MAQDGVWGVDPVLFWIPPLLGLAIVIRSKPENIALRRWVLVGTAFYAVVMLIEFVLVGRFVVKPLISSLPYDPRYLGPTSRDVRLAIFLVGVVSTVIAVLVLRVIGKFLSKT